MTAIMIAALKVKPVLGCEVPSHVFRLCRSETVVSSTANWPVCILLVRHMPLGIGAKIIVCVSFVCRHDANSVTEGACYAICFTTLSGAEKPGKGVYTKD